MTKFKIPILVVGIWSVGIKGPAGVKGTKGGPGLTGAKGNSGLSGSKV